MGRVIEPHRTPAVAADGNRVNAAIVGFKGAPTRTVETLGTQSQHRADTAVRHQHQRTHWRCDENLIHGLNGTGVELPPRFGPRRRHVIRIVTPRRIHVRVALPNLLRRQTLPNAKVDFAQADVLDDLQTGRPADQADNLPILVAHRRGCQPPRGTVAGAAV